MVGFTRSRNITRLFFKKVCKSYWGRQHKDKLVETKPKHFVNA